MATNDVSLEIPLEGGTVVASWTLVWALSSVSAQVTFQFRPLGLVLALKPAPAHWTHKHPQPL